MIRTEPPAPEPSTLPNLPYFDSKPWSSAKGRAIGPPLEGGVCVPVPLEGAGDLSRFSFLYELPILKNRLRSDIEACFSCLSLAERKVCRLFSGFTMMPVPFDRGTCEEGGMYWTCDLSLLPNMYLAS